MSTRQGKLIVVLMSLAVSLSSHGYAQTELKPMVTLERVTLPAEGQITHSVVSPNGQRYACAVNEGEKWLVVIDGTTYGPYDEIVGSGRAGRRLWTFSDDSKHFAVGIRVGWDYHLLVDGKLGDALEQIYGNQINYSPDNNSFACEFYRDGHWGWYVQGVNGSSQYHLYPYGSEGGSSRTPSERGSRIPTRLGSLGSYLRSSSGGEEGPQGLNLSLDHQHSFLTARGSGASQLLIVDGKEDDEVHRIDNLQFSRTGGHYSYTANAILENNMRRISVIHDGQALHDVTDKMGSKSLNGTAFLSPNGSCAVQYAEPKWDVSPRRENTRLNQPSGRSPLRRGGSAAPQPSGQSPLRRGGSAAPQPSGRSPLRRGGFAAPQPSGYYTMQHYVKFKGRTYGPYGGVGDVHFSDDSEHFWFTAGDFLVHDGREIATNGRPYLFTVSPDGKQVASPLEPTQYDEVGAPFFSRDSKRVAYTASKGLKNFVVVDGQEGPPELEILRFWFSPDGKDLWYIAKRRDGKIHAVRNGDSVCVFDKEPDNVSFSKDGRHLVTSRQSSDLCIDGREIEWRENNKWLSGNNLGLPFPTERYLNTDGSPFLIAVNDIYKRESFVYRATMRLGATASETPGRRAGGTSAQQPDDRTLPTPEPTDDLIESIRRLKLTPEGSAAALLRDVPEVSITIDQHGPVTLPEDELRAAIEEALEDIGIRVIDQNPAPGYRMRPIFMVTVNTFESGPIINHSVTLSVMDWMRPISNPRECIFCPCHYGSGNGFSSPATARRDITSQIRSSLRSFCQFWQQSRAGKAMAVGGGPAYIAITESQMQRSSGGEAGRAILANLDELAVAVDLKGAETSVLSSAGVKRRIESRLEALGIRHMEVEQSLDRWEQTGRVPASLTLRVRTVSNNQGYSGLCVELVVHDTLVRASVPDFALNCPVYLDGFYGADTSNQLRIELPDRIDGTVTKFIKELQLARQDFRRLAESPNSPAAGAGQEDLVAHYEFEGNASDSAGGHHGTEAGGPTYVLGMTGQAIDLDGVGDYVDCGNPPAFNMTNQISVSAWVNVRAVSAQWASIVSKGRSAWRLCTWLDERRIHFAVADSHYVNAETMLNRDQWHHVCGTFDGASIRIYIDGEEAGREPYSGGIGTSSHSVWIGDYSGSPGREWDGLIDEVRIYDRALSQTEIVDLVAQTEPPHGATQPTTERMPHNAERNPPVDAGPGTTVSQPEVENARNTTSESPAEAADREMTIPGEFDSPQLRKALKELSPATREKVLAHLNEEEMQQIPAMMRQQIAMGLIQQYKFIAESQGGIEAQKAQRQTSSSFEHLDFRLASNVVDYRKPAGFSPTNYFETVRWWIGTFNISHRAKVTGNRLLVQEQAKEQFKPFIGKPMAWIMRIASVTAWDVEFYTFTLPKNEVSNKKLYPNGTSGQVVVGDDLNGRSYFRIGSQVSKEQALSFRQGDCVLVQGRFKNIQLNPLDQRDLQVHLDSVKLTPIEDFRRGSIFP